MDTKRVQLKLQQQTTTEALAFLDLEEAHQEFAKAPSVETIKQLYKAAQIYVSTAGTIVSAMQTPSK